MVSIYNALSKRYSTDMTTAREARVGGAARVMVSSVSDETVDLRIERAQCDQLQISPSRLRQRKVRCFAKGSAKPSGLRLVFFSNTAGR